jgi:two-component sensor histidine kinase
MCMLSKSLYQVELEAITKSRLLFVEDTDSVLTEIGSRIANCMEVERVNVWLFNKKKKNLKCIANYNSITNTFDKGEVIDGVTIPIYYNALISDDVVIVNDVYSNPVTVELRETYCSAHNVFSIMDVPIYIEGDIVGVICFEKVGQHKVWSDEEQFFSIAIGQLVSLVIETRQRKEAQAQLQRALEEKEQLLAEMNHRIKNNLNMLVSLLRLQIRESKNSSFNQLAEDIENRIFSIAKIHEQLYSSKNYLDISLSVYLDQLITEFRGSSPEIQFELELEDCSVSNDQIVPIGLICNEIITNAAKYAFEGRTDVTNFMISVKLKQLDGVIGIEIRDNGVGFDYELTTQTDSFGLSLIRDLVNQLDGKLLIESTKNGTRYFIEL